MLYMKLSYYVIVLYYVILYIIVMLYNDMLRGSAARAGRRGCTTYDIHKHKDNKHVTSINHKQTIT